MVTLVLTCRIALSTMDPREAGQELNNPVPVTINVPLFLDFDGNIGSAAGGTRWTLQTKPVVPLALSDDWELAARTIAKLEAQTAVTAPDQGQTGFADLSQGLYFAPRGLFFGWLMFAMGATVSLPTATSTAYGNRRVSAGPSVLLRLKPHHFSLALLTGWIGSIGDAGGPLEQVSQVSFEGSISYTTVAAWNLELNTTTTYDVLKHDWVAPFNLVLSKVLPFGDGNVSVGAGVRVYLFPDKSSPQYGARLAATWVIPET
jgi:hypothetical protein